MYSYQFILSDEIGCIQGSIAVDSLFSQSGFIKHILFFSSIHKISMAKSKLSSPGDLFYTVFIFY
jgi:hypothetical protein